MTHEAGHFAFAKLFDVRVNEFSVGMGPILWKRKKGETQYSVRLLPVGGYCAMEGEQGESADPRSFPAKPPWKKGIIILAGATVNILTGVLFMAILLGTTSGLIGTNTLARVDKGSVSYAQGLRTGDKIVVVNDHRIYTDYELSYYMGSDKDGVMDLVVERDGKNVTLSRVRFPTETVEGHTMTTADFVIRGVEPGFRTVSKYAWLDSLSMARIVWDSLFQLITLQYHVSDLSGPIGTIGLLADAETEALATANAHTFLLLIALLAINLGVFNLIPFPALDGGRFVFIMLEGIFRKPVPESVQGADNTLGMLLLFALMILVTVSDIAKLF